MARKEEIERKFLVRRDLLPALPEGARLVQGYLSFAPTVRVRAERMPDGARNAYLTIKSPGLVGRDEFDNPIPYDEGEALLKLAQPSLISKTRYRLPVLGSPELIWELDVFDGDNHGLAVAEIELPAAEEPHDMPAWLGEEVTEDPRYSNSALARTPYSSWPRT